MGTSEYFERPRAMILVRSLRPLPDSWKNLEKQVVQEIRKRLT